MLRSEIKGSAIESAVADINRLLEAGRLTREALEIRLRAEDLALLEEKILPSLWYSLATYERFLGLLVEAEAAGNPERYLIERGRAAAERILATGIYSQLDASRERWGARLGVVMATIGPAMFRPSEWSFISGDDVERFRIEVTVPRDFPESARQTCQGFIAHLAARAAEGAVDVRSERPTPEQLVFTSQDAASA